MPEAWAGRRNFTIGETGFGTGLNFCAVAKLWQESRPAGALLHYVSIEGFPLAAAESARALNCWPELEGIAAALIERYPTPVPGLHRLHFEEFGISLTLAIGEAGEVLPQLRASVDAWFLDGFAPSRNPDMWREEVLSEIGRLAVPGGTLATFTSAGAVRRGLAGAGFEVSKQRGYGRKREMSVARKTADALEIANRNAQPSAPIAVRTPRDRIAVIGGGIAGASLTHALARRGVSPVLYEASGFGAGASGNPRALVMPRMDAGDSPAARFHAAAYRYAIAHYRRSEAWDPCGVLVMLDGEDALRRAAKARSHAWHPAAHGEFMDRATASDRAGVTLDMPGLFYAEAGLLETRKLLAEWGATASVVTGAVVGLDRTAAGIRLVGEGGRELGEADTVILAAGVQNRNFAVSGWLPLAPVRGQLSMVPAAGHGDALRCALSWGGYLSPVRDGMHLLGATHDPFNRVGEGWDAEVVDDDHRRNHSNLPGCLDNLIAPPEPGWSGRASLRAVTPDRVPLFGPVPDPEALRTIYGKPRRREGPSLPDSDVLVLGGLGSRGFMTAPLAAEILVARLMGEPWPLEESVALAGEPLRFAERASRHGRFSEFLG